MTDWHATLLGFAGADLSDYNLDGVDQWKSLKNMNECQSETSYFENDGEMLTLGLPFRD